MELSVIIVNYKTPELLLRCIASIQQNVKEIECEIIVVDNHSEDNSESLVRQNFEQVIWVQKHSNEGFGRANNEGILISKGQYVLLINSDVVVHEDAIMKCLLEIKKDSSIGVLGCKLLNMDGSKQNSVYYNSGAYWGIIRYNILIDYFIKKSPGEIEAVMGAFMLIPKRIFKKVGMFDPDFFMFAEEIELCGRVKRAGNKIVYFDEVSVIHDHGASSSKKWALKQNYLSNALLFYKIKGFFGYQIYHFLFAFNTIVNFFLMWRFNKAFRKDYWETQKAFYSNFLYYLVIPFLYKRKIGNGKKLLRRN